MNKLDDIVHKKKRGEERTENERNKIKKEKEKRKKKKRKKEKKKKRKTYIFASRNNKRVRFDFEILDPKLKITCQHWVSGEWKFHGGSFGGIFEENGATGTNWHSNFLLW